MHQPSPCSYIPSIGVVPSYMCTRMHTTCTQRALEPQPSRRSRFRQQDVLLPDPCAALTSRAATSWASPYKPPPRAQPPLHPLRRDSLPALGGEAHLEAHLEIEVMQAFSFHPSSFGHLEPQTASDVLCVLSQIEPVCQENIPIRQQARPHVPRSAPAHHEVSRLLHCDCGDSRPGLRPSLFCHCKQHFAGRTRRRASALV